MSQSRLGVRESQMAYGGVQSVSVWNVL